MFTSDLEQSPSGPLPLAERTEQNLSVSTLLRTWANFTLHAGPAEPIALVRQIGLLQMLQQCIYKILYHY